MYAYGLLLSGLCLIVGHVSAQDATSPVVTIRGNTDSTEAKSAKNSPHDVLAGDPRLDAKVTLTRRGVVVEAALAELTRQTGVRLTASGNEMPGNSVALSVKEEPLRDVLRAFATIFNFQWKKVKTAEGRDVLVLAPLDDPRLWDFLRPRTQAEADIHRAVQAFADGVASLPKDVQQALAVEHQGVAYSALPPEMQQCVQDGVKAEMEVLSAMHFPTRISLDNLDIMHISFRAVPVGASTSFYLEVTNHALGNMMMVFARPDDPAARNDTIQTPGDIPYQAAQRDALADWYDASRVKAVRDDPRLSRSVSVKSEDTSVGFPLAALAQAAHVNIVAQILNETHTVSLGPVPLKDALDQIAAKYHGAWGVAADGTILYHYRENKWKAAPKTAAK